MLFLVVSWSILIGISYILGSAILGLNRSVCFNRIGDHFIIAVWIGIIILSNALLGLSVIMPVSLPLVSLCSVGMLLLAFLVAGRKPFGRLRKFLSPWPILGYFFVSISISYVTTQIVSWYDTGGYHFGIIKWLSNCGSVPGVALLYYGFGYTSSWFALAAAFNDWILESRASTLTGGLAFLLLTLQLCIFLVRILANRARYEDWFGLIAFFLALTVITRFEIYVSPSSDLPVIILTIVICWSITIIGRHKTKGTSNKQSIGGLEPIIPLILSAGGMSIKLSAFPALLVATGFYIVVNKRSITPILSGGLITCLFLIPFFMGQIITSGCLLYPSSLLCFDLPWTIGPEKLRAVREQIIKSAQWSTLIIPSDSSWNWVLNSIVREKYQHFLILLTIASAFFAKKKLRGELNWAKWPLSIGLIGIFYALIYGPTWRYSVGYIAVTAGLLLSLRDPVEYSKVRRVLQYIRDKIPSRLLPAAVPVIVGIALSVISVVTNNISGFDYLSSELRQGIKDGRVRVDTPSFSRIIVPPKIVNFQLSVKDHNEFAFNVSSLELLLEKVEDFYYYKPKVGYQCWDAELPCSQELTYQNIQLRDPGRGICGGFVRKE